MKKSTLLVFLLLIIANVTLVFITKDNLDEEQIINDFIEKEILRHEEIIKNQWIALEKGSRKKNSFGILLSNLKLFFKQLESLNIDDRLIMLSKTLNSLQINKNSLINIKKYPKQLLEKYFIRKILDHQIYLTSGRDFDILKIVNSKILLTENKKLGPNKFQISGVAITHIGSSSNTDFFFSENDSIISRNTMPIHYSNDLKNLSINITNPITGEQRSFYGK